MTGRGQGRYARLLPRALLVVALLALASLLAACGVGPDSSGGSNYSLGLAGSTLDHPSNPPTIAANGPGGTYAFVYDNQIWLRQDGQANAKQITRIPLSNAAYIAWGPLVWSPQGKYIAFALVQDLAPTPGSPPSSSGPIYYVDTTSCAGDGQYCAVYSAGTGSIYGHTYDWLGESMLVYSGGQGIMLYTLNNPRVWTALASRNGQSGSGSLTTFGDLQVVGGNLYYTRMDVKGAGARGVVGSASVYQTFLGTEDQLNKMSGNALADHFPVGDGSLLGSLGKVYVNNNGEYVAGAWRLRRTSAGVSQMVAQRIDNVDTQSGQVTSSFCSGQAYGSYVPMGNCGNRLLPSAATQPWSAHPQLALSKDDKAALAGESLYAQDAADKLGPAGWTAPPAWSPDGQTVVVTNLVKTETDANGVTRAQTNLVAYAAGQQGATLIAGARNIAWSPASN
ncbi:MAG TPA: hypothetical protein VHR15_09905 [Ktedonobacterales bacterium]|jgi:hypothetical protein|nr:hypothetical protein [Ktedonobacterales bacterium]